MNFTEKIFAEAGRQPAHKKALIDEHGDTTYGELIAEIARCRWHLAELGIGPGDRVVFCMQDCRSWLFYYFALHHMGGISVLMNPALPATAAQHMIETCRPHAVLCRDLDSTPALTSARDTVAIYDLDVLTAPDRFDLDRCYQYRGDEIAHWCSSSGTSGGVPKWVLHSHDAIQLSPWHISIAHEINADSVIYCTPRLSFPYGIMHRVAALMRGASQVLSQELIAAKTLIGLLESHKVTHMYGMPYVLSNLVEKAPDRVALPRLQYVYSGGEQLPALIEQKFFDKFGVPILNCIGMSEIYSWCTTQHPRHRRPNSIGQPMPHMRIEVRDPDSGDLCSENQPGELWVQSPTRALGYHGNDAANARTFPDGWFRSSDIVYHDSDGWLFYVCRNDDNVKIKAGYVNLDQIESCIMTLPQVEECLVLIQHNSQGLPELGAKIKLGVSQHLTVADIRQHLANYVTPEKIPRRIDFVDSIARTVTTKKIRSLTTVDQ